MLVFVNRCVNEDKLCRKHCKLKFVINVVIEYLKEGVCTMIMCERHEQVLIVICESVLFSLKNIWIWLRGTNRLWKFFKTANLQREVLLVGENADSAYMHLCRKVCEATIGTIFGRKLLWSLPWWEVFSKYKKSGFQNYIFKFSTIFHILKGVEIQDARQKKINKKKILISLPILTNWFCASNK